VFCKLWLVLGLGFRIRVKVSVRLRVGIFLEFFTENNENDHLCEFSLKITPHVFWFKLKLLIAW